MKLKEAITILEKELKCRTSTEEKCMEYEDCTLGCPYWIEGGAFIESMQTVVEYYKKKGGVNMTLEEVIEREVKIANEEREHLTKIWNTRTGNIEAVINKDGIAW